jgi:hypothetical protein
MPRPTVRRAGSRATAALAAMAAAILPLALACRGGPAGPPGAIPGLSDLTRDGETILFARRFLRGPPPAGGEAPRALVVVVRMADGHEEMRLGEPQGGGFARVHATRPGDEFRNLAIEDINGDGRPEIVGRWSGGQLEVVEVIGRGPEGGWRPLLQNAGQVIEERRRADRTVAFWITSRTYEEESGLPPVYETRVWRWDGTNFTEESR